MYRVPLDEAWDNTQAVYLPPTHAREQEHRASCIAQSMRGTAARAMHKAFIKHQHMRQKWVLIEIQRKLVLYRP